MSEEVEDGTEVLRVTIYQECSALILESIIVMWLHYNMWIENMLSKQKTTSLNFFRESHLSLQV